MRTQKIENKLDTVQKILNYFGKYDIENRSTVERIIKAHDKELVKKIKNDLQLFLVDVTDDEEGLHAEEYQIPEHNLEDILNNILDSELNVKNENDGN